MQAVDEASGGAWVKNTMPFRMGWDDDAVVAPDAVTAMKSRRHSCSCERNLVVSRVVFAEEMKPANIDVTGGISGGLVLSALVSLATSGACSSRFGVGCVGDRICCKDLARGGCLLSDMKPLTLIEFRIRSTSDATLTSFRGCVLVMYSLPALEVLTGRLYGAFASTIVSPEVGSTPAGRTSLDRK